MDDQKLQIISQLMEELQGLMGHSEDDLGERLGREKPQVEVKMETESLGEMPEEEMMDEDCGPEEKLKSRIMKLRG